MRRIADCVLRVACLCLFSAVASCARPPAAPTPVAAVATSNRVMVAPGYHLEIFAEGFTGPTQMIVGPDERLWVAQLNGEENAGQGQVVAFDPNRKGRTLLVDGLLKPTGIALLDGHLWLATRRELNRAKLQADGTLGPVEPLLTALPFNGRSNGTLTVTPDGLLIFETSGARQGNSAATGSATLWQLDPATPTAPQPLAIGLKGAYAHTFDAAGRLWTTEIGDDLVNGAAPPDEINLVVPGANFGWPQCFGQQVAATNYGGTAEGCQATRAPVALFAPRATPTSIVATPWATDTLLVALWLQSTVAQVTVTTTGDNATGVVEPLLTGLRNPQQLLVWTDGSVLISEFATGTIYRLTKES